MDKRFCVGLASVLLACIALGAVMYLARSQDVRVVRQIELLPKMEYIGKIKGSGNTTVSLHEFEHPTRPGVTCLYLTGWRQAGLSCWRN